MKHISKNIWYIGIFMILLGIYLIGMPKYIDDYLFIYKLRDWFFDQGTPNPEYGGNFIRGGFPWEELKETWIYKYNTDNSRLGNIIVVFFLLLPKWVGSGITWLCCIYIFFGGLRLVGIDVRRSALVPLAILLFGFFMPWRNHMGSLDYQFNYIEPTAIFVFLLSRIVKTHDGKTEVWGNLSVFLIGLIGGAWQEAIAIPVLCGLFFAGLAYKDCRRRALYCAIAGIVGGLLWIFTAPGQWNRIGSLEIIQDYKYTFEYLARVLVTTSLYWVVIILLVARLCRKESGKKIWKKLIRDEKIGFIIISGGINVGIVWFTYTDARVGCWAVVTGMFGILYLLRKFHKAYWSRYSKQNIPVCAVFLLAIGVHFVTVDVMVVRIRHSLMEAMEKYISNPEEPVFVEVIDRRNLPLVCGYMPDAGIFTFGTQGIKEFYGDKFEKPFGVVPKKLEYVRLEDAERIPGDAGLMKYEDCYIIPWEEDGEWPVLLGNYGKGTVWSRSYMTPFISKADGKRYLYVYLYENWIDYNFRKLQRVDKVK